MELRAQRRLVRVMEGSLRVIRREGSGGERMEVSIEEQVRFGPFFRRRFVFEVRAADVFWEPRALE